MANPKRVEFDAPQGWVIPEGKSAGDDLDIAVIARVKSDGRICLVEFDGARMPGFRSDEDDGKTYAEAAADSMDGVEGGY